MSRIDISTITQSFEVELDVDATSISINPAKTHLFRDWIGVAKKATFGNGGLSFYIRRIDVIRQWQLTVTDCFCRRNRSLARLIGQMDKSTGIVVLSKHAATLIHGVLRPNEEGQRQSAESRNKFAARSRADQREIKPGQ